MVHRASVMGLCYRYVTAQDHKIEGFQTDFRTIFQDDRMIVERAAEGVMAGRLWGRLVGILIETDPAISILIRFLSRLTKRTDAGAGGYDIGNQHS